MQNSSKEAAEAKTAYEAANVDMAHFSVPALPNLLSDWNKCLVLHSSLELEISCTS
jgi:hypothetical protein